MNWNVKKKDAVTISKIVEKAVKTGYMGDRMDLAMDLTACHLNSDELKLSELLNADGFNFFHDIYGIQKNMNRTTGQLENFFCPRYSK